MERALKLMDFIFADRGDKGLKKPGQLLLNRDITYKALLFQRIKFTSIKGLRTLKALKL